MTSSTSSKTSRCRTAYLLEEVGIRVPYSQSSLSVNMRGFEVALCPEEETMRIAVLNHEDPSVQFPATAIRLADTEIYKSSQSAYPAMVDRIYRARS